MIEANRTHILVCRAGFEDALRSEVSRNLRGLSVHLRATHPESPLSARARTGTNVDAPGAGENDCVPTEKAPVGAGWIAVPAQHPLPRTPFVFERQRLPFASWSPATRAEPELAAAILSSQREALAHLADHHVPWTLHVFAPNPDASDSLTGTALRLASGIHAMVRGRYPALAQLRYEPEDVARCEYPRHSTVCVLQVCRVAGGVWSCVTALKELSDPYPGGVHRMPEDPDAPSRSYLKLEEALDVMGARPKAGERVVDLGASPGGWTWTFVKRGCSVIAVDRGPLKLKSLGTWGGEVTHLKEDGLRFRPKRPVDWLVSDMLVAPGVALGLVRKWQKGRWAQRYIVNLKLPQQQPDAALVPIRTALDALPGFRYRLRQLYHDRREVTLLGERVAMPSEGRGSSRPPSQTQRRARSRRKRRP